MAESVDVTKTNERCYHLPFPMLKKASIIVYMKNLAYRCILIKLWKHWMNV